MRGVARVSLSLLVLGSLATMVRPAHADPESGRPAAVYDVSLPIDGAVIAVSAAGILVSYALSARLIHPTCPCSPSSVNSFDRGVIGNASDTADLISNVTVGEPHHPAGRRDGPGAFDEHRRPHPHVSDQLHPRRSPTGAPPRARVAR